MALGNGQQRTAEHLGGIGAEAQAEGDGAGGKRAQGQVGDAEQFAKAANQVDGAEIDQQHPEQFGYAAHDGRVGAADPAQGAVRRRLGQRAEQAEHQPQRQGGEGQLDGHPGAGEQGRTESVKVRNHRSSNTEARSARRLATGLRLGWISKC